MVSSRLRFARPFLLLLMLISLRFGLALPGEAAAPFASPIVMEASAAVALPTLDIESQGFPISWILGVLFLLFFPATAVVAARYRR